MILIPLFGPIAPCCIQLEGAQLVEQGFILPEFGKKQWLLPSLENLTAREKKQEIKP